MTDARFQGGGVSDSEEFLAAWPPLGAVLKARRHECLCHETGVAQGTKSVEWAASGLFFFNRMRAIPFVPVCRVKSAGNWHKMMGEFAEFQAPRDDSAAPKSPPIRYRSALHDAPPTLTLAQRAAGARM